MVIKEKAQTATTAGCAVLICLVPGEALEALCCPSGRREEHFGAEPSADAYLLLPRAVSDHQSVLALRSKV